ncbi:phospholipase A2-like [Sardina pilchardus]|uniref:phospholipase A2-like n=1 Tax=Sardina pilchardus TaxID=27697 RepID=UPI002E12DA09
MMMNFSNLALLVFAVCSVHGAHVPYNLLQFGQMIQCAQPQVNPFIYNEYGCWCGLGGSGQPKDVIDMCCQVHDRCYEASHRLPVCRPIIDAPHIKVYDFTCSDQQVSCPASNDACQAAVCECDRVAAHCFATHAASYNTDYKNLNSKEHCLD